MAEQQTVLRAFVSSPDDVLEERECIEDVIEELNLTWSRRLQIRLELIRWESHAVPGFGENSQAVINEQIGEDYDIFIGIMWARFGTPTKHAASGTEEEFGRALIRWKENPNKIRILFYFKTTPADPYKIDLNQLGLVRRFQENIKQEGCLFRTFNDLNEFAQLIRINLSMLVQGWGTQWGETLEWSPPVKQKNIEEQREEEQGFIDLLEEGENNYNDLCEVSKQITEDLNTLGAKINLRAQEINEAKERGESGPRELKHFINLAAADMDCFSESMNQKLQKFDELHTRGADAFIKSINLLNDFSPKEEDTRSVLETLKGLEQVFTEAADSIKSLHEIVRATPRVTTNYNRAKRQTLSVLEIFLIKIHKAIDLTKDIEKAIENVLSNTVQ